MNWGLEMLEQDIVRALHRTIFHYICPKYGYTFDRGYLLEEDWFRQFVADWGVARTLCSDRRALIDYLNTTHRPRLFRRHFNAAVVDETADEICRRGWSPRNRVPVSFVSKVSYFYRPALVIPMDNLAKSGLQQLGKSLEMPWRARGSVPYTTYLDAFLEAYAVLRADLIHETRQPWVAQLLSRLNVSKRILKKRAFRLKLLDCYLMEVGKQKIAA